MNEFKAANGYIVRLREDGTVSVGKPGYSEPIGRAQTFALEEFFAAKNDLDAGRWRWNLNPHMVVYPVCDREAVLVVNESIGVAVTYTREQAAENGPRWGMSAARAYFDAHGIPVSEPRPWEEAVGGEVWLLLVGGEQRPYIVERGRFESGGAGWLHRDSPVIESGMRLWPAVTA